MTERASNVVGFRAQLQCGCDVDLHTELIVRAFYKCPDSHKNGDRVPALRVPNRPLEELRRWQPTPAPLRLAGSKNPHPQHQQTLPTASTDMGTATQAGAESGETHRVPTQPANYFHPPTLLQRLVGHLGAACAVAADLMPFDAVLSSWVAGARAGAAPPPAPASIAPIFDQGPTEPVPTGAA